MDSEHGVIEVDGALDGRAFPPLDGLAEASANRPRRPSRPSRPGRPGRPRRPSRFMVVYGFVLATLAVVALVVGALALQSGARAQRDIRDEERQQTRCERALVIAAGVTPQQKQLVDAVNACYRTN